MPNKDNTQQMSNSNSQVIAAIRALEDRIANVEGGIVARLNDTRPFEQQVLARLNELIAGQSAMQDVLTVRAQQRDLEKRVTRLEQEPIESAA